MDVSSLRTKFFRVFLGDVVAGRQYPDTIIAARDPSTPIAAILVCFLIALCITD